MSKPTQLWAISACPMGDHSDCVMPHFRPVITVGLLEVTDKSAPALSDGRYLEPGTYLVVRQSREVV